MPPVDADRNRQLRLFDISTGTVLPEQGIRYALALWLLDSVASRSGFWAGDSWENLLQRSRLAEGANKNADRKGEEEESQEL